VHDGRIHPGSLIPPITNLFSHREEHSLCQDIASFVTTEPVENGRVAASRVERRGESGH
jgi:hypothetical protein